MYGCTHRLVERLYTTGGGNEKRVATAKAQPTPHAHHPLGSNLLPVEYNSKIGLG